MQETDPPQRRPDNNMPLSVVAMLLFWPLAIPAVLNAWKVDPLWRRGDPAGAAAAAAESRKWSRLALITGLIWYAVVGLCCAVGGFGAVFGTGSPT
ncbi:MAG TPA: CD225/dispanin family protein [Micromonosporaceae bacterium]